MRRSGGDARVAEIAEDAKLIIRGRCTEEKVMRCKVPASTARPDVNEE
jgi:hypothetical protein